MGQKNECNQNSHVKVSKAQGKSCLEDNMKLRDGGQTSERAGVAGNMLNIQCIHAKTIKEHLK